MFHVIKIRLFNYRGLRLVKIIYFVVWMGVFIMWVHSLTFIFLQDWLNRNQVNCRKLIKHHAFDFSC